MWEKAAPRHETRTFATAGAVSSEREMLEGYVRGRKAASCVILLATYGARRASGPIVLVWHVTPRVRLGNLEVENVTFAIESEGLVVVPATNRCPNTAGRIAGYLDGNLDSLIAHAGFRVRRVVSIRNVWVVAGTHPPGARIGSHDIGARSGISLLAGLVCEGQSDSERNGNQRGCAR